MTQDEIETLLDDLIALRMELEGVCETIDTLVARRAKDWLRDN